MLPRAVDAARRLQTLPPEMLLQATDDLSAEPTLREASSDRRAHPRIPGRNLHVTRVRIPNRPAVSLVDLSGGALLQITFRARPGSRFAVQLQTPDEKLELPFQLLRCYVADIREGVTYHAAGAFEGLLDLEKFDGLLDLEKMANRASDAVPALITALEQLQTAGQKSAIQTRADAEFTETLGEVIAMLRGGEAVDLVALKVKARLRQTYESLTIVPSQSSNRGALTSVDAFGYALTSRHALSVHDRRVLKSNAQLISMLDACCREMREEFAPPSPPLIYGTADWQAQSPPTTSSSLTLDDVLKAEAGGYRYGAAALALRG
jgi:hypothetical protein